MGGSFHCLHVDFLLGTPFSVARYGPVDTADHEDFASVCKAWLHYDLAFQKDANASGLADWSCMSLDLYNFQTHHPSPLPLYPHHQSLATCHLTSASRGMMAPVTGPLVNVGTATAAKNVKGTTHMLTAPFGPLARQVKACVLRPLPVQMPVMLRHSPNCQ